MSQPQESCPPHEDCSSHSMPISNVPLYDEIWWEIFLGIGQGGAKEKGQERMHGK